MLAIRWHRQFTSSGKKIESLGETFEALLAQSCDRLIGDDEAGGGFPGKALTFLSMSTQGLTETDIRTLLFKPAAVTGGNRDQQGGAGESVPYADWAYTLLKIKHLVSSFAAHRGFDEVSYTLPFSQSLRILIRNKFGDSVAEASAGVRYFSAENGSVSADRKAVELPQFLLLAADQTTYVETPPPLSLPPSSSARTHDHHPSYTR